MADNHEISMVRGDSYSITFTVTDEDTGIAIDLTGVSGILTVDTLKSPPDNTTKVFDLVGTVDATPTSGKISFLPTTLNTADIGKFFYDVQLTFPDGSVRTIVKSTFAITQDITK